MNDVKLRAWKAHRQGLDGRLAGKPAAEILSETGWARSVGGVNPYLTLFARGGVSRESADAAAAALEIYELPSARGCTYVLPAADFALGLAAGQEFAGAEMNTARKLGVSEKEIDKLSDAILRALVKGPLSPDELREAVGAAARSLGEEGKKKGLTTTMPVALGNLQLAGEIRRVPLNGRFDQQRYRYALWRPNPLAKFKLSREEVHTELARRFFRWIFPASASEFQAFAGIGVKAAKAAVAPLGLVAVEEGDERLLLPEERERFRKFELPKKENYVLVGSIDGIILLHQHLTTLVAPEDLKRRVYAEKGIQELGALNGLTSHAILDRGRLVGFWEYDTAAESIAWMSFVPRSKALQDAVKRTEEFVRMGLGDARSFSLDSPKSRAPKIEAIRKAAAARA